MAKRSTSLDESQSSSNGLIKLKENLSSFVPFVKRVKRERIVLNEDSELFSSQISDNLVIESNKKIKCDTNSESDAEYIYSSNSNCFNKRKNKDNKRIYRPRVMESSSDEETNDPNLLNNNKMSGLSKPIKNIKLNNVEEESVSDTKHDHELSSELVSDDKSPQSDSLADKPNCDNIPTTSGQNVDEETMTVNDNNEECLQRESSAHAEASLPLNIQNEESGVGDNQASSNRREARSRGNARHRRFFRGFLDTTDSDDSLDDNNEEEDASRRARNEERASQRAKLEEEVSKSVKKIMEKSKPKQKWNSLLEVIDREYSNSGRKQTPILFKNRYADSMHVAQRLELMSKLDFHNGCVNALSFNGSGDLIASGSDDLQIAIWDWSKEKTCVTYNSGHRNNVLQVKFLHMSNSSHIVSCSRDGQVRLAELAMAGVCKDTRRLAKHSHSANKIATRVNTPFEILSAGEDAVVFNIDIRIEQPDKIVLVKDTQGTKVPLYSIHSHPLNDDQFCVAGQDEYVRVYDRRIISPFGPPVIKYCPNHLVEGKPKPKITCAVYSNSGDAILASYTDEDIYLFNTNLSEGAEYIYRYSGHRNSSTVKGVNFFSPSSNYIISGSDCGNIFIWERETQAIVNFMPGDENGVVNVLESHPHLPILATSGLDNDVKIWVPSGEKESDFTDLQQTLRINMRHRLHESSDDQGLETHMLLLLFQHLRRNPLQARRRASGLRGGRGGVEDYNQDEDEYDIIDSSDSSSENSSDSDNNREDRVQCSTH